MKKLLPFLFSTAILFSCNSKNQDNEQSVIGTSFDTSILYTNNVFADTASVEEEDYTPVPTPKKIKQSSYAQARKRSVYQHQVPETTNEAVESAPFPQPTPTQTQAPTPATEGTSSGGEVATAPSTEQTAPAKKEGWSNATKGAVIGGIGGAVGGVILSKKKGKGAIIGGILGAGGGYVIGRARDKKKASQ